MNKIDFSKPGGFPLTQDELDYLQNAYTEAIKAVAAVGGDITGPLVISGMAVTNGGNTVTSGWFCYNGNLIKFTGGTVTPGAGEVALVLINNSAAPLTYNDGSMPNVVLSQTATLTHAATVTDATHFPVSVLTRYNGGPWTTVTLASANGALNISGYIRYRKDVIANTLLLQCTLTVAGSANAPYIDTLTAGALLVTLPAGFQPSVPATILFASSKAFLDSSAVVHYLNGLTGQIDNAGNLFVNILRPAVAGPVSMICNVVVPLD